MTDVVARVSSSVIGALIATLADGRRRRAEDERVLRRTAADDLLSWLPELRDRLRLLQSEHDFAAWKVIMTQAFASCRRVRTTTPTTWSDLARSLRDAIGNGAGSVIWIDISPQSVRDDLAYDHRWSGNAAEYLDYVQYRVQLWKAAFGARAARRVRLLSYNDWLIRTVRVWPDDLARSL